VTTDRIFLVFATIVGIASGGVIVLVPQSRNIGLQPYFWVLIAIALFELVAFLRRGGQGGPPISMQTRIIGFLVALGLAFLIPMGAGLQVKMF
jgi:hypothetical protein